MNMYIFFFLPARMLILKDNNLKKRKTLIIFNITYNNHIVQVYAEDSVEVDVEVSVVVDVEISVEMYVEVPMEVHGC